MSSADPSKFMATADSSSSTMNIELNWGSPYSQLQQWNQPRKRKLEPCNVADISFVKHEHGKQKRPTSSMVYDPRPIEMQSTSDTEIASLGKK